MTAAEKARAESLPKSPADYKFEVAGIKLPDGSEFAIDPTDPLAVAVSAAAHKAGIPQEFVTELASAFGQQHVAALAKIDAEAKAQRDGELKKLGANGEQRLGAVEGWLKTQLGDKFEAVRQDIMSAATIEVLEDYMKLKMGAGHGAQTANGADPTANMTPMQKIALGFQQTDQARG